MPDEIKSEQDSQEMEAVEPQSNTPSESGTQDGSSNAGNDQVAKLRKEAAKYRTERNDARTQLEALQARMDQLEAQITEKAVQPLKDQLSELTTRLNEAEKARQAEALKAAKLRAASEAGLPAEMAERLTGDNPEALAEDAAKLAKLLPSRNPRLGNGSAAGSPTLAQQIKDRIGNKSSNVFSPDIHRGKRVGLFSPTTHLMTM